MKFYTTLIVSTGMFFAGAFPAHAQFGDLLKKAQETIEQVTESPVESVTSTSPSMDDSEKGSTVPDAAVAAPGTLNLGNYPDFNSESSGSPTDVARYEVKGISADMTADEFKSLVATLGGSLEDKTRDTKNPKTVLWAEDLTLTVGGFKVAKLVFESRKNSGSFRVPATSSRNGPYGGVTQEVTLRFDKQLSQVELEKIWQALDGKFLGRENRNNWHSSYVATDPETGEIAYLSAFTKVGNKTIEMKHQIAYMLPPPEIEGDDF